MEEKKKKTRQVFPKIFRTEFRRPDVRRGGEFRRPSATPPPRRKFPKRTLFGDGRNVPKGSGEVSGSAGMEEKRKRTVRRVERSETEGLRCSALPHHAHVTTWIPGGRPKRAESAPRVEPGAPFPNFQSFSRCRRNFSVGGSPKRRICRFFTKERTLAPRTTFLLLDPLT
ncbi:hypothetical protein TNCT_359461 [Trichonephila clavata]|uniref:Uncharacterized protein n=1 Tax=Trichonephila clavata TaxID=2740835 RepID=A0A8X6GUI0_TRICU|nr:hypothetical protein TNCT_359461 [Trichonephila clavata]